MRALSPIERSWLVAASLRPPFAIEIVVEGPVPAGLEDAVRVATDANPGVRGRLRGWLHTSRWEDVGDVPVHRVATSFGPGPQRQDPLEGVDVTAFSNAVVFRGRHALVDGRGLLHFAADVYRVLRGEPPLGSEVVGTDLELAWSLGSERIGYPPEQHAAVTGLHQGGAGVVWGRRTIPGPVPNLLQRVMQGIVDEAARHLPDVPVCLHVPVDLRREGERTVANRTGMLFVTPDALDSVRARRHEAAAWIRALGPVRFLPLGLLAWVAGSAAAASIRRSRFGATAVVSNLGPIDPDRFVAPEGPARTVYMVPPGTPATAAFIALQGFGDHIEIVAVVPEGLASDGRLDALLDRLSECREPVS